MFNSISIVFLWHWNLFLTQHMSSYLETAPSVWNCESTSKTTACNQHNWQKRCIKIVHRVKSHEICWLIFLCCQTSKFKRLQMKWTSAHMCSVRPQTLLQLFTCALTCLRVHERLLHTEHGLTWPCSAICQVTKCICPNVHACPFSVLDQLDPVCQKAEEIVIMLADVCGMVQRLSVGWESSRDTHYI